MTSVRAFGILAALAALSCASPPVAEPPSTPEGRAVRYLAREVPKWQATNKCFSCHNNGDAARALYAARRSGIPFDPRVLQATSRWLRSPDEWKFNGPMVEYSDKKLATLQFAHALAAAGEAGEPRTDAPLRFAADRVRELQETDGSWAVDAGGLPGSPVTYGKTLATVVAHRLLVTADRKQFAEAIARAERWLADKKKPLVILDAASLLAEGWGDPDHALALFREGQTFDGGWGPYVTSPPEVFDTALVLLALARHRDRPGAAEMIRRGREFLIQEQNPDGSWPETTRPPGAESYAQRISTTGWALLALLHCR
jgi:hypothetical protein